MTTAILISILLAHPQNLCSRAEAKQLVTAARKAGKRYDLPPSLLLAVVLAETGCRNVVATGRGKGKRGCDVGYSQIHVPECDPTRVTRLLDPERNLRHAARILRASRNRCSRAAPPGACRHSRYALYNPGSSTWWDNVKAILEQLRDLAVARQRDSS